MARLIRFLVGVVVLGVGGVLLVRYGETAFLSLVGQPVDVRVKGPCRQPTLLWAPRAPECEGDPNVLVGRDVEVGHVVPARRVVGRAYAPPDGVEAILGYVSPVLIAIGFGAVVARGRSAGTTG